MKKALEEYAKMGKDVFERKFNEYKEKVENNPKLFLNRLSLNSTDTERSFFYSTEIVKILCRDCGEKICSGNEIKKRESNYVCENKILCQRVQILDKKFYCLKTSCGKELGRLMELRNAPSLFIVDIKGVKFEIPDLNRNFPQIKVISKWSKAHEYFSISSI